MPQVNLFSRKSGRGPVVGMVVIGARAVPQAEPGPHAAQLLVVHRVLQPLAAARLARLSVRQH